MTTRLDPTSLRLFVAVIEEGTIAAAAVRENIAAAAVSKRIAELEALLGVRLLNRDNRGVSATPDGLSLLFMARGALNNLAEIVERMRETAEGQRGSVHLLANISALAQDLPDLLASFRRVHPSIRLQVEQRTSLRVTRGIADNEADIGIFTRLPHGSDIDVLPFRRDKLCLAVAPDHPLAGRHSITFVETLDYEHVTLGSGTHLGFQLVKAANDLGRSLRVALAVEQYDALLLMVAAGIGVGIVPEGCVASYREDLVSLIALDEVWATRDLMLCVRDRERLSAAARLLLEHLLPPRGLE